MLSGYKTYIVAGMGLLSAIAGYLTGDLTIATAGQMALTSILGATIRAGVAKAS